MNVHFLRPQTLVLWRLEKIEIWLYAVNIYKVEDQLMQCILFSGLRLEVKWEVLSILRPGGNLAAIYAKCLRKKCIENVGNVLRRKNWLV